MTDLVRALSGAPAKGHNLGYDPKQMLRHVA
jgi:hypothetical protein